MASVGQILASGLIWMLLGTALRMITIAFIELSPAMRAGWRIVWGNGQGPRNVATEFGIALDNIYIRLLSALTTPASATLLYAGIFAVGVGLALGALANILRYVTDHPERWIYFAQSLRVSAIMIIVIGASCLIAAVSQRRTSSLLMSGGFVLAGLGVGAVTVAWGMQ